MGDCPFMIMPDSSIQCDQLNKKPDNKGIKNDGKKQPLLMLGVQNLLCMAGIFSLKSLEIS